MSRKTKLAWRSAPSRFWKGSWREAVASARRKRETPNAQRTHQGRYKGCSRRRHLAIFDVAGFIFARQCVRGEVRQRRRLRARRLRVHRVNRTSGVRPPGMDNAAALRSPRSVSSQQLRQLRDIGSDPPCFISGQKICRRASPRLILEVHIGQLLTGLVADDEAGADATFVVFLRIWRSQSGSGRVFALFKRHHEFVDWENFSARS